MKYDEKKFTVLKTLILYKECEYACGCLVGGVYDREGGAVGGGSILKYCKVFLPFPDLPARAFI